jgi:hypothetical protein
MLARLPLALPRVLAGRRLSPQTAVVGALFVVFLVAAFQYAAKAARPSALGTQTRTAFLRWRPQVLELRTGTNIYRAFAYPNPPVMALVLWPFYELPPITGALAWFGLKVVLAFVTAGWVFNLFRNPERQRRGRPLPPTRIAPGEEADPVAGAPGSLEVPDWAKLLAIALTLHPVLGDLSHGNVNLFVAFLVVAALALYCRRWDASAGVVLALAVACKVTPALFLPYFAWKRAWKLLAGAAIGLVLWLAVVPAGVLGWGYNRELLTGWFDVMVRPFVLDGKVTSEHPNQSVPGLTFRLLTREPSFVGYDDQDKPFAAGFANVADIGADNARLVVKGCMALFALAVVLTCRWPAHRPEVPRGGVRLAAEFALVCLGMLLFSERTWKHHAVTLILPYAALAAAVAANPGPWRKAFLIGVLAAAAALTIGPSLVGGEVQDTAMVYGTYTAAFALLAVAIAVVAGDGRLSLRERPFVRSAKDDHLAA